MKRAVMLMCVLAGCATASEDEPTEERESALRCDPFCDPQDLSYEPELQGAFDLGFSLFADAIAGDVSCTDIGTDAHLWDCVVSFSSKSSLCGAYVVECLGGGANQAPRCNWKVTYACP